jgi:hypothetical protein
VFKIDTATEDEVSYSPVQSSPAKTPAKKSKKSKTGDVDVDGGTFFSPEGRRSKRNIH